MAVLQLSVITEFHTCVIITYHPSIKQIGFGDDDTGRTDHKEWALGVNMSTLLYNDLNLRKWRAYETT